MPRIPVRWQMEVLTHYFDGFPYDEVVKEMKRKGRPVSKGSVVNIVKEMKKGVYPRFDRVLDQVEHLRRLAVDCRKQGLSVPQASLGLTLFKRLIRIGVEPSSVEDWVRMCKRLSLPAYPVERFVESALRLRELEEETGRGYSELVQSFQEAQIGVAELEEDRRKKREEIEKEIQGLKREREKVKAMFEDQGLTWNEGVKMLKDIADLRGELEKLKGEKAAAKDRLEQERENVETTRCQVSSVRRRKLRLEAEVFELSRIYQRYRDWYNREAPQMDEYESTLLRSVHRLEEQKRELEETNSQIQERSQRLKDEVKQLKVEIWEKERKVKELEEAEKKTKEILKGEIEEGRRKLRKYKQEKRREIEETREKVKEIVEKGEEEKERLRRSRIEREKIERALRWLRPTLNSKQEELNKAVRRLKELEEAIEEREKKLEELIRTPIRLPKLPPLPKEETGTLA